MKKLTQAGYAVVVEHSHRNGHDYALLTPQLHRSLLSQYGGDDVTIAKQAGLDYNPTEDEDIETFTLPILSEKPTSRIPRITALDISTSHMPESEPDFGTLRHVPHQHGYIVWLAFSPEEPDSTVNLDLFKIPAWFMPILRLAEKERLNIVLFDADGPVIPKFLAEYDW
jgi:hypothetical protein